MLPVRLPLCAIAKPMLVQQRSRATARRSGKIKFHVHAISSKMAGLPSHPKSEAQTNVHFTLLLCSFNSPDLHTYRVSLITLPSCWHRSKACQAQVPHESRQLLKEQHASECKLAALTNNGRHANHTSSEGSALIPSASILCDAISLKMTGSQERHQDRNSSLHPLHAAASSFSASRGACAVSFLRPARW